MRKAILGILAAALLAAICWASNDPWKDKAYSQWDDKDIQRILTDSPWERNVTVAANWQSMPADNNLGAPNSPQPAAGQAPSGGGMGGGGMKGGGGAPGGAAGPSSQAMDMTSTPQAGFSVFWMSSRTLRAAIMRRQVLHEGKDESEVDKYADHPLDDYEVVIQGRDMTPFNQNDETFFLTHSSLEIHKTKEKLTPQRVTLERGEDGKKVTAALFFFQKKSSSGENAISPDDKEVQFTCSLGKSVLKTSFDPRKMTDQKGSDL